MKLCIGLTGGIGCGKSTVSDMFAELGAGIVDTDAISHQLTQAGGDAIPVIQETFGRDYISSDGSLNRPLMRQLIFTDPAAKRSLEKILHPLILNHAKSCLRQTRAIPYNILVAPLLLENPQFRQLVRRILVVDCREDTQIDRVSRRDHLSEPEIQSIISQQMPRNERLRLVDDVIYNDDDLVNLSIQVATLHKYYSEQYAAI